MVVLGTLKNFDKSLMSATLASPSCGLARRKTVSSCSEITTIFS